MRFNGFLALFMRSWLPTIIPKRGCALYTKLRAIHHFKGRDKGCVLYTRNYGNSKVVFLRIIDPDATLAKKSPSMNGFNRSFSYSGPLTPSISGVLAKCYLDP